MAFSGSSFPRRSQKLFYQFFKLVDRRVRVFELIIKLVEVKGIVDRRGRELKPHHTSEMVQFDTLANLMGHKDTRMTRRYAHIGLTHLASAISQLEKSYGEIITKLSQSKEKELPETGNSLI